MRLLVTPTLERAAKKLHTQLKTDLDTAVRNVADDPEIGEAKVGDLVGVRVFKFRMNNQLCMLSYRVLDENALNC